MAIKFSDGHPGYGFTLGGRRYEADPWKEHRAESVFHKSQQKKGNTYLHALKDLSSEDEELPLPEDQGPIVYKDGIFQIDIANAGNPSTIDPALKGLIDSILK
ncbi:MAG: hypothetical protein LLF89_09700 [Spirochaetaceae bacterium]|nr:hypothetical protein [Spirochaetaceae bacterium]